MINTKIEIMGAIIIRNQTVTYAYFNTIVRIEQTGIVFNNVISISIN